MSIGGWNEDELERFIRDRLAPMFAMAGNMGSMPVGGIMPWLVSTAPAGFLLVAGQAVTTQYAALRDLLLADGSPHGTSGGNPLLPDLRGRLPVGLDNMGGSDAGRLAGSNTLGAAGGSETVTLTAAQSGLPAHGHTVNDPGHVHAVDNTINYNIAPTFQTGAQGIGQQTINSQAATTGITINNVAAAAASQSHNNMPPYLLLPWIVKA